MSLKAKLVLIALGMLALLAATRFLPVRAYSHDLLAWIDNLGPLGPLIFTAIYIVACVLLVPASLLTLGAGVLFGVARGTLICSIASTLGATAAFLTGRYLAREWVARQTEATPRFRAINEAVAREGWKIVLLTRLSPLLPFNLLNYAFGLSQVSLRDYFFASWVGMLPGTLLYVYVGSLIGDLGNLSQSGRSKTPTEWAFFAAGLVATAVLTLYTARLARRSLATKSLA
jgi:uncharacterized membrane protein YdjX (TVP38/TMEM64 family)